MKRILFILLSVFFLQISMSVFIGGSSAHAADISVSDLINNSKSHLSAKELTEINFYNFIRLDVIGKNNPIPKDTLLYYTGFSSANQAYDQIINLIVQPSDRVKFDDTHRYEESTLMVADYTDIVDDGFAKLTVTFTNRKDLKQCAVVFKSKK